MDDDPDPGVRYIEIRRRPPEEAAHLIREGLRSRGWPEEDIEAMTAEIVQP